MLQNEELEQIRSEVESCQRCPLFETRTKTVFGQGNPEAEIMFIGEAPGANEDKEGIPFCGAAGKFLDEMLAANGLKREEVYIANTLKCRPPGNRDPEPSEKDVCKSYLEKQIEIINPKLIVLLGRHSLANFLPMAGTITALHGKALKRSNGKVYLPLYHPAAALHNGSLRSTLQADFAKIPAIMKKINQENINNNKEEVVAKQQKLI